MVQAIKIFSKSLTDTDIKKRMAIPAKILPSLPDFNGSHAVTIHLIYGKRKWPVVCSTRKKGYRKPVFSIGWRNFVVCNKFNVGDKLALYKVQEDQPGSFHYRVQVEKPAKSSWHLSPPPFSLNREVDDQSTGTSRMKPCNFQNEKEQQLKANAPVKQEEAITELANVAADEPVAILDHVITKPISMIFGTNVSADQATSNAHFKTEEESKMKLFGITKSICMGEPSLHSYYMTNEEREIKSFVLANDVTVASNTSQAVREAYYESHMERLPISYAGELNLDLTLAPPIVDEGYQYSLLTQNHGRAHDIKES